MRAEEGDGLAFGGAAADRHREARRLIVAR